MVRRNLRIKKLLKNSSKETSCCDYSVLYDAYEDINKCTECWENYFTTKKKDDCIKCVHCKKWMHENCTMYR